jgi:hypothetical protein
VTRSFPLHAGEEFQQCRVDLVHLADITDDRWRSWAAALLPTLTTEAVIAWLDAGHPDPDQAARGIRQIVDAVIKAAQVDELADVTSRRTAIAD